MSSEFSSKCVETAQSQAMSREEFEHRKQKKYSCVHVGDIKTIRKDILQSKDIHSNQLDLDAIDHKREREELINYQPITTTCPSFLAIAENAIAEVNKKRPM